MTANASETTRAFQPARTMRPCMVSFFFYPEYSGSAIQAYNLCRHLVSLGAAPFIVAADLSGARAYDRYREIPLYRLPVMKNRELQIPSFAVSLLQFLFARRNDYDIIHAHGTLQHCVASIAGRILNKPTILKVAMAKSDIAF